MPSRGGLASLSAMRTSYLLAAGLVLASTISISVLAAPAKVTGFTYSWPRDMTRYPALVRYLQTDRTKAYADYAPLFDAPVDMGPPSSTFESSTEWAVRNELPGLIALAATRYSYTGGAHGLGFVEALLWDTRAGKKVSFAGLFTNPAAAKALLTPLYCRALDKERLVRRGEPTPRDDIFGDCPDLMKDGEIWPDKPVYGKYSRIAISLSPYTAGPYAEGSYDLEIIIPKGLKRLVKVEYRSLFPG